MAVREDWEVVKPQTLLAVGVGIWKVAKSRTLTAIWIGKLQSLG